MIAKIKRKRMDGLKDKVEEIFPEKDQKIQRKKKTRESV